MHLRIVLNRAAGTIARLSADEAVALICNGFQAAGHQVECRLCEPAEIEAALRDAARSDADCVVVGGGDGTIATAADLLKDSRAALGVLPLGTMNLLAHDLGTPLDLQEAVAALAAGEIRPIDAGEVNGKRFLSHASIGLYPKLIEERERQRDSHRIGKWPAMALAAAKWLPRAPRLAVSIDLGQGAVHLRTTGLLISNNPHQDGLGRVFQRPRLDTGRLGLYIARHQGPFRLLRLLALLAVGMWRHDPELDDYQASEILVNARNARRMLKVALDGDIHRMAAPLQFRSLPGAVRMLMPRLEPAAGKGAGKGAA